MSETPIFSGRYGTEHDDVVAKGCIFDVYEVLTDRLALPAGIYAFASGARPDVVAQIGDGWSQWTTMAAYNVEDAVRNFGGAHEQWRAWIDGNTETYLTVPFQDKDGNFPADGGEGEYAAYPPDDAAKDGITRSDRFTEDQGYCGLSEFERPVPAPMTP